MMGVVLAVNDFRQRCLLALLISSPLAGLPPSSSIAGGSFKCLAAWLSWRAPSGAWEAYQPQVEEVWRLVSICCTASGSAGVHSQLLPGCNPPAARWLSQFESSSL